MHKCRYTPSKPFWTLTLAESQISHCKTCERLKHDILRPSVASGCLVKWASCSKLKSTLSWAWEGKAVLLFSKKKQVSSFMGLACWFRSWCYRPSMEGSHAQDGAKTRSASDASLALAIRMACARSWRPAVSSSDIVQNWKTHIPCPIPQPQ